jgi:hypothetical protein
MAESDALQALLTFLHSDPVEAAEAYRRLQQRLIRFFGLTASSDPQQLVDETIDRLARRTAEGAILVESATDPASSEDEQQNSYSPSALVFSVAHQVLREDMERSRPDDQAVHEWLARTSKVRDTNHERRQTALRSCLSRLAPERRHLLENYYGWRPGHKGEHQSQLAQSLGLSLDALRNKVLRSRVQLESCVRRKAGSSRSHAKGRKR